MEGKIRNNGRNSSYLPLFVLLLILAASAVFLLPVYRDYRRKVAEREEAERQLELLREERNQRRLETDELVSSPDAVEKVARERFNLVRDKESVLVYETPKKSE